MPVAEGDRVFLRGITSEQYGLAEFRRRQREAPRVIRGGWKLTDRHAGYSSGGEEGATWLLGPGDEPFLTQTIQAHLNEIAPGGSNRGHGHQNEATFYILEGKGYEIHDGVRYEWEAGDLVVIHNDSVHRHFNASQTERAFGIIVKAKAAWMYLGLVQQGNSKPLEDADRYGEALEWSRLWTPGATEKVKVVKPSRTRWETTRDGRVRVIASKGTPDVRVWSVDLYEQEIAPGSRSAKHWHMADEVCYVTAGSGESLQWEVAAEIGEKYRGRIAKEPSRWSFQKGDVVYVPQNTVHEHRNAGSEPLRLLVAQNRLFKHLGYDSVVYLADAPGASEAHAAVATT